MIEPHPLCLPLMPLLGAWHGAGVGGYPTIDDFDYTEELVFAHTGRPFLSMTQRSQDRATGRPLHAEAGYLRALPDAGLELVVAQPSGIVEVDVGRVTSSGEVTVVELSSASIGVAPTAKRVTAVRRRLSVTGSTLVSELWMAAVGETDLVRHLRSELSPPAPGRPPG